MRIVITGGLGFIGQNLAAHFRQTFDQVELISIDRRADIDGRAQALFDRTHRACFADPVSLQNCENADVLVHLAANTTVQGSISCPTETYTNNISNTHILLEHLRLHSPDTKFIFASTGGAIAGEHDGPVNEQTIPHPVSPYGASKLAVEGLLSAYQASYGLNYASLRFSNVYGPYSFLKSSVISAFCKMYLQKGSLQVNGDGQQTRDYIHVSDVSKAISAVILLEKAGVFQVGTGVPTSIRKIVDIFKRINAANPGDGALRIATSPALRGEVRNNLADISKLRRATGFEPITQIEDGVRSTLDWFRAQALN